jgi:hypothetical protein
MSNPSTEDLNRAGFTIQNGTAVRVGSSRVNEPVLNSTVPPLAAKPASLQVTDSHGSTGGVEFHSKPRMNRTETELYGILKARGYDRVDFEAITLTLGTGSRYTPDFLCVQGEKVTFFEAKGAFIREAALVRLKVAARMYPEFTFILAQKKAGKWTEKRIEP